jgi:hypothetical protein
MINIRAFYEKHIENIISSRNGWYSGLCSFHDDQRASFSFESRWGHWRSQSTGMPYVKIGSSIRYSIDNSRGFMNRYNINPQLRDVASDSKG